MTRCGPTTQAVPIFVISLARAQERRTSIAHHLATLNLTFTIVDAVDGHAISPEARRALLADGKDRRPGEVGCYLSHIEVYRRIVIDRIPVALILEDDARLHPAIAPVLRTGIDSCDFDYCLLDYVHTNEQGQVFYDPDDIVTIGGRFKAYATHAGPAALSAYLITLDAAERRLCYALPIRKPIDVYTSLPYRPRFRAVVAPPAAGVGEEGMYSSTTPKDHDIKLSFRLLRSLPGYYAIRDTLYLEYWRQWLAVPKLRRSGVLNPAIRWRPLPPGLRVLL